MSSGRQREPGGRGARSPLCGGAGAEPPESEQWGAAAKVARRPLGTRPRPPARALCYRRGPGTLRGRAAGRARAGLRGDTPPRPCPSSDTASRRGDPRSAAVPPPRCPSRPHKLCEGAARAGPAGVWGGPGRGVGSEHSLLAGLAVGRDAAVALAFAVHACGEAPDCHAPVNPSPPPRDRPRRHGDGRHTRPPLAGPAPRAVMDGARIRPGAAPPPPARGGIRNGSRRILNKRLFPAPAAPPAAAPPSGERAGETQTAGRTRGRRGTGSARAAAPCPHADPPRARSEPPAPKTRPKSTPEGPSAPLTPRGRDPLPARPGSGLEVGRKHFLKRSSVS